LNILQTKFAGKNSNETIVDGDKQQASFVSKNKDGEYFFGHFFSKESYSSANLIKKLIASTWNRRNDKNYTRTKKDSAFSKTFTNIANSSSGSSFNIGSSWACKVGWTQYNFDVDETSSMNIGSYSEWKAAYYLTNSVDGKDYYALAIESCMAPNQSSTIDSGSDYLNIYSDLKLNQTGQLLRTYAPTQNPSTNTYSYNIGESLSKTSSSASVGASWSTSVSDIELLDQSQPCQQIMNIKFNYKWPYDFTSYCKNTSWQTSSIICQLPAGSSYAIINNSRTASFAWKTSINASSAIKRNKTLTFNTGVVK
jgi:hypothetical protein